MLPLNATKSAVRKLVVALSLLMMVAGTMKAAHANDELSVSVTTGAAGLVRPAVENIAIGLSASLPNDPVIQEEARRYVVSWTWSVNLPTNLVYPARVGLEGAGTQGQATSANVFNARYTDGADHACQVYVECRIKTLWGVELWYGNGKGNFSMTSVLVDYVSPWSVLSFVSASPDHDFTVATVPPGHEDLVTWSIGGETSQVYNQGPRDENKTLRVAYLKGAGGLEAQAVYIKATCGNTMFATVHIMEPSSLISMFPPALNDVYLPARLAGANNPIKLTGSVIFVDGATADPWNWAGVTVDNVIPANATVTGFANTQKTVSIDPKKTVVGQVVAIGSTTREVKFRDKIWIDAPATQSSDGAAYVLSYTTGPDELNTTLKFDNSVDLTIINVDTSTLSIETTNQFGVDAAKKVTGSITGGLKLKVLSLGASVGEELSSGERGEAVTAIQQGTSCTQTVGVVVHQGINIEVHLPVSYHYNLKLSADCTNYDGSAHYYRDSVTAGAVTGESVLAFASKKVTGVAYRDDQGEGNP